MNNKREEKRHITTDEIELRSIDSGGETVKQEYVDGLGVVYDKEEELWEGYFESVSKNAFDKWLKKDEEDC